jgi:hypothetical protein
LRRIWKHLCIGRRWLIGGGRLFMHNPWLLGGMGFMTAVLISALALIPLLGGLLIALLAPILLASAYLAIDGVYRQKMALPASLRLPALKQSPRQLFVVFRDEARLVPTAVACLYSASGMLLINLPLQLLPGNVWVANWSNLDGVSLFGVLATALLAFVLYVVLAASLIYALPLTFLRDEPLIPSLLRSLKASRHFVIALLILLGALLTPILLGAVVSLFALWAGYFAWLVASSIIFPAVVTSLYCSYLDIFTIRKIATAGGYSPVQAIAR